MPGERHGKVDFHLHSYASNVTDYYAANTFAIPESYSDPIATYHELRRQGMTLVTLTDHNSIDGVKEMLDAHLPGVFISAEMTTTFPEDGCNIHVTVANMTEAQFREVDRLRSNVYEMCSYVEDQIRAEQPADNHLAYFMTHPVMSTQNRPYGREGSLTADHIEKALLLFRCLEVRNGTRTRALNEFTHRLISSLDRETIERLANKHGILPRGERPWLKAIVAGSDDHSGINPGRTWTEFALPVGRQAEANDLIEAIRNRTTAPAGSHGGPISLAHSILKLLYDGNKPDNATPGSRPMSVGSSLNSLLRYVFDPDSVRWHHRLEFQGQLWLSKLQSLRPNNRPRAQSFEKILSNEARTLLSGKHFQASLAALERTDDRIFKVVSTLVNRVFQRYVARLSAPGPINIVSMIKEAVALVSSNVFVSLPYLISYLHQATDRAIVSDIQKRFNINEREKLVLVTDTLFDINGVARTIRRMMAEAEARGIDLVVVSCLSAHEMAMCGNDAEITAYQASGRVHILPAIANADLPTYQGLQIRVPPFLDLLKFLQESGFTKMQISTPGTVGLAGLMAAKLLQIETSATYHTSFPEYVEDYTRDISLEALAWKYMILFYHSVDEVVVPSKFIARLLHQRGLRNRKLLILDRWVDTERFHPRNRIDNYWQKFGLQAAKDTVKFLYVGRVGLEKNLDILAQAFEQLLSTHQNAHLIVVGDGPYREALQTRLANLPATFTGFLNGKDLQAAFASADVKLFPSTTDTWGNAPLEGQASGLPVVVSDKGGPHELMLDGITGLITKGRDVESLRAAMEQLMDPSLRHRMAKSARAYVEANRLDEPFQAILDAGAYRRRAKAKKKMDKIAPMHAEPTADADHWLRDNLLDHRDHSDHSEWAAGA